MPPLLKPFLSLAELRVSSQNCVPTGSAYDLVASLRLVTYFLSGSLNRIINDPSKVTPELVRRKTDFANVVGRDWESFIATQLYERGNPLRVLGHVRAPSLVLWGDSSEGISRQSVGWSRVATAREGTPGRTVYITLSGGRH